MGTEGMDLDDPFPGGMPGAVRRTESDGVDASGESSGPGPSEMYSRRPRSLPAPLFMDDMHNSINHIPASLGDSQPSVYSSARAPTNFMMQPERLGPGPPLGAGPSFSAPFPTSRSATPAQNPADYLVRPGPAMSQVRLLTPAHSCTVLASLPAVPWLVPDSAACYCCPGR